ncbi:ATP-dependent DNA helicase UvrD2 [Ilumatobacter nonamiensis]|uniref:ATP-dependent DNA helicase UvrD2 n=1 Tax=Ilumatobacter nonamiensis TaxID=467093 RepID=UPI000346B658|nr:ATP-dependent DNA helicase UvrD2 [Ilumatobacter nonamiensis]
MAIACAYCGGEHDRPADVRACWTEHGEQELPLGDDPTPDPGDPPDNAPPPPPPSPPVEAASRARPVARAAPAVDVERGVAAAHSGPDRLGRHAVIGAGDDVPKEWADADRLTIDEQSLRATSTLDALRVAAATGRRLVIEVHPAFDLDRRFGVARTPMLMTEAAPFEVGADFEFVGDELHHLLWSNTVDLRGAVPTWDALDRAVAAGLQPVDPENGGDVVLADGTAAWIDAGPLRFVEPIDGVPVVHAVTIEHGRPAIATTNRSDADLAPDQLAAVTHPGGAARIIAPAGSGKTRVLTERARHLLTNWNLPASAVSLVAFNKRAQEEMRERTPDLSGLHVRTLNAIGLAIVNGTAPFAPQPTSWRTINEVDVRRLIGDLVSFPKRRNSDPVAPWIEALSLVRLGLVAPDEVETRYEGDVEGFAAFWPTYRAALERRHQVDFDDQIYRALMILLSDPAARRTAQRACRTMLVDEFQDLTPAHLLLIRLLAAPGGAVFGVGDDDQTIYGYNGADPGWLIDFGDLFPNAGAHPLEVNYRCPGGIVDIADRLLRHNRRRVSKVIRAASTDPGGWSVAASVDPVDATARAVREALAAGAAPSEVAVLTRVNAVLAPVQVALVGEGILIAGGVGLEFLDRTSVRSVLAWIRLALTDERSRFLPADLGEALRRPSRSFHPRITSWISEQGSVVDLFKLAGRLNNERDADRLMEFAADIQTLQKMAQGGAPTSDLVLTLIDEIGLAGSVSGLDATRRGMNRSAQGDDLTAVRHLAALHDDAATFDSWLRSRLATHRSADGVVLSTVHRVKGQEWPHVVVHHADAEQYPHRLAEDVEEERRLFHVAITRASAHVTIVPGPDPSPFVEDLTEEPKPERVVSSHRPAPATSASAKKPKKADPTNDLDADAAARFDRLKTLRTELAAGKPAYVVFDNKTLAAIARTAPTTKQELSRISGVGPAKLDKYGDSFVELITTLI